MTKLTLEQFVSQREEQFKRFQRWWADKQSYIGNEDLFPNELLEGDWDEQFQFFIEDTNQVAKEGTER